MFWLFSLSLTQIFLGPHIPPLLPSLCHPFPTEVNLCCLNNFHWSMANLSVCLRCIFFLCPFLTQLNTVNTAWLLMIMSNSSLPVGIWAWSCTGLMDIAASSVSSWVQLRCYIGRQPFLVISHGLWLSSAFSPLLCDDPWTLEGRGEVCMLHWGLSVLHSLILCTLAGCGLLF